MNHPSTLLKHTSISIRFAIDMMKWRYVDVAPSIQLLPDDGEDYENQNHMFA